MSDGPHRSLPMRKGWKKLAERGDGRLHTAEQVREAVPLALADDWRAEGCDHFMKQVRDVLLGDGQSQLFKPTKDDTVNALKKLLALAILCGEFSPTLWRKPLRLIMRESKRW